jgi:prevent-host-death family protein
MLKLEIYEAKTRWTELLKLVEKGWFVTVTNRGIPVANLVPSASRGAQQTKDAIKAIKAMQKPGVFDDKKLNEMRNRGRR